MIIINFINLYYQYLVNYQLKPSIKLSIKLLLCVKLILSILQIIKIINIINVITNTFINVLFVRMRQRSNLEDRT